MDTDMVPSTHPRRAAMRVASLALTVALVASGTASAAFAQDTSPMPSAGESSASGPVIHGWIGARSGPAGLYSFMVGAGRAWMHHVPEDFPTSGSAEITFQSAHLAVNEYGDAFYGFPLEEMDEDYGGPYSEVPELVAEAEAIVGSIYVEPAGTGLGRRVVFTLPDGWDSG